HCDLIDPITGTVSCQTYRDAFSGDAAEAALSPLRATGVVYADEQHRGRVGRHEITWSSGRPPIWTSDGAAQHPPPASKSPAPPQTPVAGSTSSLRAAATWSPARLAATLRTCS